MLLLQNGPGEESHLWKYVLDLMLDLDIFIYLLNISIRLILALVAKLSSLFKPVLQFRA